MHRPKTKLDCTKLKGPVATQKNREDNINNCKWCLPVSRERKMSPELLHIHHYQISQPQLSPSLLLSNSNSRLTFVNQTNGLSRSTFRPGCIGRRSPAAAFTIATKRRLNSISASLQPLDLTEENVSQVLADARVEASRVFALFFISTPLTPNFPIGNYGPCFF